MIIIYYKKNNTGEFTSVHVAREGDTMETLRPLIEKYNAEICDKTCGAVEVAEDSLEAYLFSTRNQRAKWDREAVNDAIESVRNALDYLQALEV